MPKRTTPPPRREGVLANIFLKCQLSGIMNMQTLPANDLVATSWTFLKVQWWKPHRPAASAWKLRKSWVITITTRCT